MTEQAIKKRLVRESIPLRAWLLMNRSFLRREKNDSLFQLAFVLSHLPTFVSRMLSLRPGTTRTGPDYREPPVLPNWRRQMEAFYGTLPGGIENRHIRATESRLSPTYRAASLQLADRYGLFSMRGG